MEVYLMLLTTKWEYKELDDPTVYDLNEAGHLAWIKTAKGWEKLDLPHKK